jgi:hypothetical protein
MAVGMVAMLWPWGMQVPRTVQYALFGAGAVFFAVQLVRPEAGHGRTGLAHHALMMLAMVWMVVAMPLSMGTGSVGATAMPGMPGMLMPGPAAGDGLPAAILLTGVAAALCLVVGTLHWTARNIDRVRAATAPGTGGDAVASWHPVAQTGCHAAMSLGMATMLVVML